MNNYFDDLYNEVYEYTYDTIMENETVTSNRGGGNKKNVNPKIKKKIKHKKRKLLLLITAMIAAFVFIKKKLTPDIKEEPIRKMGEEYATLKWHIQSGKSREDYHVGYDTLKKAAGKNTDITISYCDKMLEVLNNTKKDVNAIRDVESVKNLLIIEKRLKNPITRLLDSKYLTPEMQKRIKSAYDGLDFFSSIENDIDESFFEED